MGDTVLGYPKVMHFHGDAADFDRGRFKQIEVSHWDSQAVFSVDLLESATGMVIADHPLRVGGTVSLHCVNGLAIYRLTEYELLRHAWYARLVDHDGRLEVRHTWDESDVPCAICLECDQRG